ncbi:uncharacterized protein LOC132747619 [Ruditapes philippinarum]|uniref:uncharacterized protein LOC132747619 n=1 Tax=Ruditapes philippinarum TaxID=129788 RepID=UPI00295B02F0|nr:uncharacterized protein LOC132747619 [Ruditapes philippinarum]XP_060593021.1 uncharacterized protein LOC132747619 [Ruditapes philippinarum]
MLRAYKTVSNKKRSVRSTLSAILLTCSVLINIYLLVLVPVKTVKIRNIVTLKDKDLDYLKNNQGEHVNQIDLDLEINEVKEIYNAADSKEQNYVVAPERKENKDKNVPKAKAVVHDKKNSVDKIKGGLEICSEYSQWTNYLVVPDKPTDLKNWNFKTKAACPKFSVDIYPTQRHKVSLRCNGPYSKFVTSVTTSTRDITSVEFGNICLSEAIDNCCLGKKAVPNVVHFIWYADKELGYFQFISFMSALRFLKPCLFLIHGLYIPKGKYWDYFVSISPNVIHVVREKPTMVFGKKLAYEEHASDIMRIEALKFYGGIYLDFDEIVLRPLEPLRKYDYTQGHERDVTMGSQLVISKKNATFLNHWYNSYRDDYRKSWAWNALWVPDKLSKQYPNLIHVEGYNFTRPNWQQVNLIFNQNYDWSTNYGMHLYIRWYKNETNNVIIRTLNTTIGAVCRHVLFGNKELCVK